VVADGRRVCPEWRSLGSGILDYESSAGEEGSPPTLKVWPRAALRRVERGFGLAMRAIPRPLRYRAALVLASVLAPLISCSENGRRQMAYQMDSAREIALSRVLESMTRSGTAFDPRLEVEGVGVLDAALAGPHGMLIVATHALMNSMILRLLLDRGRAVLAITGEPIPIPGTRMRSGIIPLSPGHLFRVRTALRDGNVVGTMIDGQNLSARRGVLFHAATGAVHIAPEMLRLAARCGARIVFLIGRLEGSDIVLTLGRPASEETVADDFVAFVRGNLGLQ